MPLTYQPYEPISTARPNGSKIGPRSFARPGGQPDPTPLEQARSRQAADGARAGGRAPGQP